MNLEKIYAKRGFMYFNGIWVAAAFLIISLCLAIIFSQSYESILKQSRVNWETKRCDPIYMPFAGVINPIPGLSTIQATSQNFDYCIQQDFSGAFNLLLLPLEFVSFSIISAIEGIVQVLAAISALLDQLKFKFGDLFQSTFASLSNVVVPVMLQVLKFRDTLAKANAAMVTTLYTSMTIYSVMVSGVLNVMNILFSLLTILIAALIAMFLVGAILIPTPLFPVGFGIVGVAQLAVLLLVVPAIAIYVIMHQFINQMFRTNTSLAPGIPNLKRPKRPRLKFW
jgi:hypothetical protein